MSLFLFFSVGVVVIILSGTAGSEDVDDVSTSAKFKCRLRCCGMTTRVLVRICCRAVDIGSLYFTANGYGSCVGFSVGRNIRFRFLNGQSLGWLISHSGSCGCRPGCTATVWSLDNDCFIDLHTRCRG